MGLTTVISRSTLWIVAMRHGNAALQRDWSTRRRRIRSSSQRSQQRDRILENALVDWINVMLFRVSTWPQMW